MAAIDFPASPTTGQTFTAPNGVIYQYDGVKWVVGFSPTGMVAFRTGSANGFAMTQWVLYTPTFTTPAYNNGGGLWDGTSYTVKTAGLYQMTYKQSLTYPAAGGITLGQGEASFYKNGSLFEWTQWNEPWWAGPMTIAKWVNTPAYLAVNDTIQVRGVTGNYNGISYSPDSWFSVIRLGS